MGETPNAHHPRHRRRGPPRHRGAFGLAGTFVASAPLRETLWAIDGAALVVAAALLTMKYQRLGNDCVAAGFLTFLAGESLLLAGNAAGLEASVPAYVGGISLWAAALGLVGASNNLCAVDAAPRRAILFVVTVAMVLWGAPLLPTSAPLPAAGYPFLVLTFVGWIWTLLKSPR
ncbi:hypothetical protein [Mesorhizobium sp. LNJC391B00]|uniref:hypothetical protein n=1 Tax=Mesorhizobium sp. LNJC391B00 TaxID=1287273 RepID=UPI0004163EBD|nr:hypothetical protein [Mesorhizobium sp. LNJC391B00]